MTTIFYSTQSGLLLRIIDRTLDPTERIEKLRRADRRWIFRKVQAKQTRRAAKERQR